MNADRVNPIVVKELRQGLKSRSFIGSFMGLQALMAFSMMIYMLVLREGEGGIEFPDGLFWFLLGILLIGVMPFRAFQAIHEERRNNTIEAVLLTRMTSWDVAFGKFTALVLQVWLMVAAVLPYLVLRYFLGAVNLAEDLLTLGLMVAASMLLTAAGVAVSGWQSRVFRVLLVAGAVLSLYMVPLALFGVSRAMGPRLYSDAWMWAVGLVAAVLAMLLLVEYGASTIAPPAENHARRKRGMALILIVVLAAAHRLRHAGYLPVLALLAAVPVCVDALCEPFRAMPSLYRGAAALHPVRRAWRRLFYPGWPSGIVFVAGVMALMTLSFVKWDASYGDGLLFCVALSGALVFPLALILLVRPRCARLLPPYLAIQFVLTVLTLVFHTVDRWMPSAFDGFALVTPLAAWIGLLADEAEPEWAVTLPLVTAVCFAIVFTRARASWCLIRTMEQAG